MSEGSTSNPAKEFLEFLASDLKNRCAWCRRGKHLNRKGLCGPCNSVRLDLERTQKAAEQRKVPAWVSPVSFSERDLKIAEYKKEDCIECGKQLEEIVSGDFNCMSLEHYFRDVAEVVASDEHLHYNLAGFLEDLFSPEQLRALGFLFWEAFSEKASHTRSQRAMFRFDREYLTSKD